MKCPKCGYNSFEFHDICKKCSHELNGYKATYGLKPIVMPQQARTALAAEFSASALMPEHAPETLEPEAGIFSFDLPAEDTDAATGADTEYDDPFAFIKVGNEETTEPGGFPFDERQDPFLSAPPAQNDDERASLLEAVSFGGEDPFAVPVAEQQKTPAPAAGIIEFDLSSFSWDEPAVPDAVTGSDKPESGHTGLTGGGSSTPR
ncbi:hypothetical protein [Geobacter sp. SVR]|uniref:hypothetical protein n=1 Tax=Geobacter sp. SVR TaxID=2495594 RepID=UPI00143EFE57|nr:hypothetical protein [Geobacter sp. SVR]BCS55359.1 hypothetical protein GSVR_36670 [Geobacter sp. SVR]GCF87284.1 hypothetical protein GSbR_38840 [Geobacter sp. SVR]